MKNRFLFLFPVLISLALIVSCSDPQEDPVVRIDKHVRVEFFTESDFTGSTYDNHYLKIRVGAIKMTYDPYLEEKILNDTTDWIAFKDIPTVDAPLVFETVVPQVDIEEQTVLFGYTYVIKVGDYTELHAVSEFVGKRDTIQTMKVRL